MSARSEDERLEGARADGRYGRALLFWLALLLVFCAPFFRGEVIFPHDNARELGLATLDDGAISNRFFSDDSSVYVPELAAHLNGERSGWISTWNPHVELGRPTGQLAGLGKAFWPTHLASFVLTDPVRAQTWLTMLALGLAGLFAFLLLRELGLGPLACWTGAVLASLGVYPLFWLTFAVHLWSVTWTLSVLWAAVCFVRRPGLGAALGVAFLVHSMLLSAYPQAIVWAAYLIVPFVVLSAWRARPGARCALPLFGLALATVVGALSVAPVWLDVLVESERSARGDINASYFLPSLPRLRGIVSGLGPIGQLVDAFRFGNPVGPTYEATAYKGTSLAPAFCALAVLSLAALRRTWPLVLLVAVALVMTLRPTVYLVGVERLGLGISRFPPLAGVFVPLVLLVAYGVERVSERGFRGRKRWALLAGVPYAVALGAALVPWRMLGQSYEPPALEARFVVLGLVATAGGLAFVATRRTWIWAVVVAASTLVYGWQLALVRPRDQVHDVSPVVEVLRELTQDGTRFAKVGARVRILPPNQEAWLGLRSVHTYNSLVSRDYREWVVGLDPDGMELGHEGDWADYVEEGDYGRQFRRARQGPGLWGTALSWMGVSVLLSKGPLDPEGFEPIGGDLYRPRTPVRLEAQLLEEPRVLMPDDLGAEARVEPDVEAKERAWWPPLHRLHDTPQLTVERIGDRADKLRFRTSAADAETILFVSQQFHPSWVAFDASGAELETLQLLGFYQGVRVPPGTTEVELRFVPHVRYAWIPQLAFALAAAVLLFRRR